MKTVGVGGFGKAKLTKYQGKQAVVKFVNSSGDPRATLATCTMNRTDARNEGLVMILLSKNKNIAEVYGIEGHAIYMKYYPLGSLRKIIDDKKLKIDKYSIAYDIVNGLSAIHEYNFVHSDLKATNILCEEIYSNKLKKNYITAVITDFGTARLVGMKPIGYTHAFAPPEMGDEPLGFETDLYSLGKLFIELFTGECKGIGKINYDNYESYVDEDCFLGYSDFYELVGECLSDEPEERTTLNEFKKFFKKHKFPFV